MGIVIADHAGNKLETAVAKRLHGILSRLEKSSKTMQDSMLWSVRNHFQSIYPGSSHYSPDKVTPKDNKDGKNPSATVSIDVPGVTRAYHDITIVPRTKRALTIPMHRAAYGKAARSFDNLFVLTKKDGKAFLVQNKHGSLVFMYFLAKRAFQRRDPRLMPSDQTLKDNIFGRLTAYLAAAK